MAKKPFRIIESGRFTRREDEECVILGIQGFSTRCIQTYCRNLSGGQIAYRLRQVAVRRMDYRDGTSDYALMMMRNAKPVAEEELKRLLIELQKKRAK